MEATADLLTTQHKRYDNLWCSRAAVLPGYIDEFTRKGDRWTLIDDFVWGWKLFRASPRYKAVITGSERLAFVFAILQKLRRRKVPHIFMQSMWDLPKSWPLRAIKRLLFQTVVGSCSYIVVYSRRQLELYPNLLGIPLQKLVFLHSHTSVLISDYSVSQGDYIFSGGDSNRDYRTLIEAVRGLPRRVVIVSRKFAPKAGALPNNVALIPGLPLPEFNQVMAGAAIVVVALKPGKMETGGRSVYGNGMALGKPVIVADDDASDYIRDGHDGLVVPAGDVAALRVALNRVLSDPVLAERLGRNATQSAEAFEPAAFFRSMFALADDCARKESGSCPSGYDHARKKT